MVSSGVLGDVGRPERWNHRALARGDERIYTGASSGLKIRDNLSGRSVIVEGEEHAKYESAQTLDIQRMVHHAGTGSTSDDERCQLTGSAETSCTRTHLSLDPDPKLRPVLPLNS